MARLPQEFIDQVLDRTDIVDVIDRRVKLKKRVRTTQPAAHFIRKKHPLSLLIPKRSSTTALVVVQVETRWAF